MLRIAIYSAVVAVIVLPFMIVAMRGSNDTVSNMMKIVQIILFGGALLLTVIYLVYYILTRRYAIILSDEGIRICNCAVRINGAQREPIDDITMRWDEIEKLSNNFLTTPVIYLSSGEKIGIRDKGEGVFGGKVWKDIQAHFASR